MRAGRISPKSVFAEMRQALSTHTGRSTQKVFYGEIATAGMGFLINVLLLRKMPVEEYGLFSLFLSCMMLLSGFMHFGWAETYVRFGSRHFGAASFASVRAHAFRNAVLGMMSLCAVVLLVSPWVAEHLFKRGEFAPYVQLAAFGALVTSLFSFFQNDFRVHQDIRAVVLGKIGPSATRLALGLAAVALGMVTLPVVSWIYVFSAIPFLLFPVWRSAKAAKAMALDSSIRREMGSYNNWIFLSFLTTTIIGNIDAQFLAHFHDNSTISAFGAAGRLTLPIQMIVASMTTTLLPKLSTYQNVSDMRSYLRRVIPFIVPLALLVLAMVWLAPPALIWIAGERYSGITVLLRLQILTTLVLLISNPFGLILNAWGWSRLLAFLNIAQLIVDLLLNYLWIPHWGAVGAVAATLVINLMGMTTIYLSVWYGLRTSRAAK